VSRTEEGGEREARIRENLFLARSSLDGNATNMKQLAPYLAHDAAGERLLRLLVLTVAGRTAVPAA